MGAISVSIAEIFWKNNHDGLIFSELFTPYKTRFQGMQLLILSSSKVMSICQIGKSFSLSLDLILLQSHSLFVQTQGVATYFMFAPSVHAWLFWAKMETKPITKIEISQNLYKISQNGLQNWKIQPFFHWKSPTVSWCLKNDFWPDF